MPITDAQIQDLINKTNIISNVVINQLDVKSSVLLANILNGNNAIQNRLTGVAAQNRSDLNLIQNNIISSVNNVHNTVYNDIKYFSDKTSQDIQNKINAINSSIQLKIDSNSSAIQQKLDSINAELKQQVTTIVNPILQEVVKATNTITNNVNNSVISLETDIKQSIINTQNLINKTSDTINGTLADIAKITANLNNNQTPSGVNLSGFTAGNPLYDNLLSLFSSNSEGGYGSGSGGGGISEFLLNLITGNANRTGALDVGLAKIPEALHNQVNMIANIIERTSKGEFKTLEQFYSAFRALGVDTSFVAGILQFMFILPSMLNIGKQLTGAFDIQIQRLIREQYDLNELETNEVITLFKRHFIDEKDARERLNKLGVSFKDIDLLLASSFNIYSPQELFRLHSMGILSDEQLEKGYLSLGYRQQDFKNLNQLYRARPAVQDIISFAVKEVFSADTVKKFGQNEDFPEPFKQQAALLGLSEEYAKMYWAAHWQLPSATMGYDMFHRGLINKDELKLLLKSLDVMPFWREKLVELSYNVVGRIDVRRLYAYGIWDKTKVYQQYLKEGYSPDDARDLTTFTIKYDDEQDNKHKTALQKKAHDVYIKAYLSNLIDKQTCINKIVALGYKQQDIELELSLEDYEDYVTKHKPKLENHTAKLIALSNDGYRKRALSRGEFVNNLTQNGYTVAEANTEADYIDKEQAIVFKETVVKEIQKLYFDSLIDDNGVLTKLMALGFANQEALNVIYQLQILKSLDDKKPSQVQFEKMYKLGIVSKDEYYKALGDMGYNEKYIPHLIALAEMAK